VAQEGGVMDRFYVGLHQPSDAQHFSHCCIHVGRLKTRQKPLGCDVLILDSQAFRILELHGEHLLSPAAYAALARQISKLCTQVVVVTQDYMCEQYIFQKRFEHTGVRFTVADHQRLTIARYDALHLHATGLAVMPVLQGYAPHEYVDHIRQYGRRLTAGQWVGVGSVCKRNGDPSAIRDVLYSIRKARPDLKLHGFGLKSTALAWGWIRDALWSADSMAWSLNARKNNRNANDWHEAEFYHQRINGALDDLPMFRQAA
jgi:hypothetical protein